MTIQENTDNKRLYAALTGIRYIAFLRGIHQLVKPDWYFEVGSLTGDSLGLAKGNAIAVDPKFGLKPTVYMDKKELHLFQMTSDDFFKSNRISQITATINMAFLDGMHLFEFLLRDFINTEKVSEKAGLIAMHDCIPITEIAAEREWDTARTAAWTGDVWKIVPILKKYRPDLKIEVLDCPPSGLTVVTNLDPENSVLTDNYDAIINEFMGESIRSYGKMRLLEELQIASSREWSKI